MPPYKDFSNGIVEHTLYFKNGDGIYQKLHINGAEEIENEYVRLKGWKELKMSKGIMSTIELANIKFDDYTLSIRSPHVEIERDFAGHFRVVIEGYARESHTYEDSYRIPEIKKVIYRNPATIVLWSDGSKTVAKVSDNDLYSPEAGLSICIAKKLYGKKIFKKYNDPNERSCWVDFENINCKKDPNDTPVKKNIKKGKNK